MAEKSTYIKLDRNIKKWRWYHNANTFRVFIDCLISANVAEHDFENITIKRGELATSYEKIANTLNLTISEVRTAIKHLKMTGEIAVKIYPKFQVISIVNYGLYQGSLTGKKASNSQSFNIQLAVTSQQYKNDKNDKNDKNERESHTQTEKAFGKFCNVKLSNEELNELKTKLPNTYEAKIDRLSEYMYQSGKTYRNHYEKILEWAKEDEQKNVDSRNSEMEEWFDQLIKKNYEE